MNPVKGAFFVLELSPNLCLWPVCVAPPFLSLPLSVPVLPCCFSQSLLFRFRHYIAYETHRHSPHAHIPLTEVHTHKCMPTCTHATYFYARSDTLHTVVYTRTHTHFCTHIQVCTHTFIHTQTLMHTHTSIHTPHTKVCAHTLHTPTLTHTYSRTHTHWLAGWLSGWLHVRCELLAG